MQVFKLDPFIHVVVYLDKKFHANRQFIGTINRSHYIYCSIHFHHHIYCFQCLNIDGVTITISVSFQFRVRPTDLKRNVMEFKNYENYMIILRNIGKYNDLTLC